MVWIKKQQQQWKASASGRGLFTCHLATVISCAIVTGTTSAHDYFLNCTITCLSIFQHIPAKVKPQIANKNCHQNLVFCFSSPIEQFREVCAKLRRAEIIGHWLFITNQALHHMDNAFVVGPHRKLGTTSSSASLL